MTVEAVDKRESILMATLGLIAEHGFHGSPMSEIAERAKIGVGTIYRYFPGKQDLVNALYIETKKRVASYILRGFEDSLSVRDGIMHLLKQTIQYFSEHPAELFFAEQYEHSPLIRAKTRSEGIAEVEPILRLLERGVQEGELKDLPCELLGALISGPVFSVARMFVDEPARLTETSVDAGVGAIWDSIRQPS
jgi:AcrR family transcriptional regulator